MEGRRKGVPPVGSDDFRTDDADVGALGKLVCQDVHHILCPQVDVIVRNQEKIHVRIGKQGRRPGIAAGCIAIVLTHDDLAARPDPERFGPGRIPPVVRDDHAIRAADPGELLPDEPLRAVIVTIIDDDDTEHCENGH